jgi:hypothetical protein
VKYFKCSQRAGQSIVIAIFVAHDAVYIWFLPGKSPSVLPLANPRRGPMHLRVIDLGDELHVDNIEIHDPRPGS